MRKFYLLGWLLAILAGCDNVLPQNLEERVRTHLRESRAHERMESEVAVFATSKGKFVVRLFADTPRFRF